MGLAKLTFGDTKAGHKFTIEFSEADSGMNNVIVKPAAGKNNMIIEMNQTESSVGLQSLPIRASPLQARLPASLVARHKQAIIFAQEYRRQHGDPIKQLSNLIGELMDDPEAWQSILDEPYG